MAAIPTNFPSGVKETQEGIVRPEGDSITSTLLVFSSKQATQEKVVPRSIPMIDSDMVSVGGWLVGSQNNAKAKIVSTRT